MGRLVRTPPGPWRVSDGLLVDPNPNLNMAHKTLLNLGHAAYRCQLRYSGLYSVILGLVLTTVLTTMWAVFGDKRRTLVLLRKRRFGSFMHLFRTERHTAANVTAHS